MERLHSHIDTSSAEFRANRDRMQALVDEYRGRLEQVRQGGGAKYLARHREQGKMPVRERIDALIDPGSPFLELSPLAAWDMYDGDAPSAGVVTGIGRVSGRDVLIVANDATVKGGTYYPLTVKKHLRAQEVALHNHLPCVYLVDSGGAFLPMQADVFPDRDHFGRIFFNQARMSAERHSADRRRDGLVHGRRRLRAGDVGRDDHRQGHGHDLPRRSAAREGRDRRRSDRRGSRRRRCSHAAVGRRRLPRRRRRARARTGAHRSSRRSIRERQLPDDMTTPEDPAFDPAELYGIVNLDLRKAYDVREVIARIVDGSRFDEFKERYATTLVCGFARLHGFLVGIIANNGVLFSESALKATHFIELCNMRGVPLIFLQNITGFMVGKQYERGGIAKDGAKMVHAVANSVVPKFTVIIGGSFGAGNYGMCGRAYEPRLLWMWPNARISVMGGEQAAGVLTTVKREQMAREGQAITSGRRSRDQAADPREVRQRRIAVLLDGAAVG